LVEEERGFYQSILRFCTRGLWRVGVTFKYLGGEILGEEYEFWGAF